MKIITTAFFALLLFSCTDKKPAPLFELMENTGIDFNNKVTDGKLENSFLFRNFYNGGGVAIGDLNNDGLSDVLLTSNMGENKIYLNKGNFKFEDITAKSGFKQDSMWSTGVVFADINNDGWLDIFICNSGHMTNGNRRNKLYINNHNLSFTESAEKYGLNVVGYTTQVSFFDYDNDGDLDCFMINNSPIPVNTLNNANRRDLPDEEWKVAPFLKGGGNHLFRNDDGHFKEVTKEAGIHTSLISFGLGVSAADINLDGWQDVYVSNDSYERDYLYINQKDGTFKDETDDWIQHMSMSSMGADVADINNDGYPEIFTTDMMPLDNYRLKTMGAFDNVDLFNSKILSGFSCQYPKNCLQLNNRNGKYIDIANLAGVSATDWSWGALMFDADNDGFNDLFVCNGVNRDVTNLDFMDFFANDVYQKMVLTGEKKSVDEVLKRIPQTPIPNKAFRNLGNLKFADEGNSWGFTQTSFSNGAAYGDLDNDGTLDLVINNENGPAFIYKNNSNTINKNHSVSVLLKGNDKNTFAIGSKINIYLGEQVLTREVVPSRGFQSSVDYKQIIGLGKSTKFDSMIVIWPDRTFAKVDQIAVDTLYVIQQPKNAKSFFDSAEVKNQEPFFQMEKTVFEKHVEDDNVDFYYERNIPEMLSREGPKAAVGDLNGDGTEDIYIGGTKGHAGQIYLQNSPGKFTKKSEPLFDQYSDFEDDAVLFFDAENDGDLDIFVGPGGNNSQSFSRQMQSRLYINDGKANFSIDVNAFPENGMNTGVAIAGDFNKDGFSDLFVGGRNVPREYGVSPKSYVFINNGKGQFTDIAKTKNPDISQIGMVTGAVFADVSADGEKELIITGEWMAPRIFSFKNDHFEEVKSNLNHLFGLWKSIEAADVNHDGKTDLILGNIGENFYLRPDSASEVKLWINDFNQNGSLDKILTNTVNGKDLPVFLKHDLQDQIPSIKKQNLKHEDYATKSIQQLFPEELLKKSIVKKFNYCASIVAINKGNGQFDIQKLPMMAQLSSVNAIVCTDVNSDGNSDLVLGGNLFGFLPQFERLDASFGDLLLNNGKGNFRWVEQRKTGFNVEGMVRDIVELKGKEKRILFLRNDNFPVLYKLNKPVAANKK
jgi:hypothetical protein